MGSSAWAETTWIRGGFENDRELCPPSVALFFGVRAGSKAWDDDPVPSPSLRDLIARRACVALN